MYTANSKVSCRNNDCEKKLCEKMEKAGIRRLIAELKASVKRNNNLDVHNTCLSLIEIIETYECSPRKCLLKRIEEVRQHAYKVMGFDHILKTEVETLIAELEAFL